MSHTVRDRLPLLPAVLLPIFALGLLGIGARLGRLPITGLVPVLLVSHFFLSSWLPELGQVPPHSMLAPQMGHEQIVGIGVPPYWMVGSRWARHRLPPNYRSGPTRSFTGSPPS